MRRLILLFAIVAPILLLIVWPHSIPLAILILATSHALILYPTLRPNVQWLGPVITSFQPEGREVWLTIDDGPCDDTLGLLDELDARGAKATFFVKGELARARPDLVRTIAARGHGIANHSETHPAASFWCLPPGSIAREIDGCGEAIRSITGGNTGWFRAPVGMKNPAVHPLLARRQMRLIGWSIRGFDSIAREAGPVVRRIVPKVRPGSIIVMHQGRTISMACVTGVVDALLAQGYSFVIPSDERLNTSR